MSKETVLSLLRANSGAYLSGEGISAQLGISRAAVWKAVESLRHDGYSVDSRPGLGYRLLSAPDLLTEQEIRARLGKTEALGSSIVCFDTLDSTNSYLKREASHGAPHGTVVIADGQTAGRGRRGRSFESARGKGLYFSCLLRPELAPERLMPLTALTAVAVCDAVERVCGLRPQIKWTNDLILNNRKLAGILTELSVEGESGMTEYAVIGIGINVSHAPADFGSEVAALATSLVEVCGTSVSRAALSAALIEELDKLTRVLSVGELSSYLDAYRRDCITLGRQVQLLWRDVHERVTALDVDEEFGLVVRRENGIVETVRTGEVSVRGLYGYVE